MTSRERRTVVIGAGIAGLLIGVRMLVPAVAELRLAWSELRGDQVRVVEARRLASALPSLDSAYMVERDGFLPFSRRLLSGASQSEAIADLGMRVAEAAEIVGIRLGQTEELVDSVGSAPLASVGIRVQVEADLDGLVDFLAQVEADSSLVRVTGLSVTATDPHSGGGSPEVLRAEVLVRGWRRASP